MSLKEFLIGVLFHFVTSLEWFFVTEEPNKSYQEPREQLKHPQTQTNLFEMEFYDRNNDKLNGKRQEEIVSNNLSDFGFV